MSLVSTASRLAQLDKRRSAKRVSRITGALWAKWGERGVLREARDAWFIKRLLCTLPSERPLGQTPAGPTPGVWNGICKPLDFLVFSDKIDKSEALSHNPCTDNKFFATFIKQHFVRKEMGTLSPVRWSLSNFTLSRGIITFHFITCKLHHKQCGKSPPTSVVNYAWKTLVGVDDKIFTIYSRPFLNCPKPVFQSEAKCQWEFFGPWKWPIYK